MIDEEELPVTSGIASETKRLIDSGHYVHGHKKVIDDEDLSSCVSAREQKQLFEQGAFISNGTKRTVDESELDVVRMALEEQRRR